MTYDALISVVVPIRDAARTIEDVVSEIEVAVSPLFRHCGSDSGIGYRAKFPAVRRWPKLVLTARRLIGPAGLGIALEPIGFSQQRQAFQP